VDRARPEAFGDGVFAVAFTLLALDLALDLDVEGPGPERPGVRRPERWRVRPGHGTAWPSGADQKCPRTGWGA
jgi:hypothetical protein